MNMEEMARKYEIFRVVNGSKLYGTNVETSDRDEIGICIPLPETMLGFQNFEQFTHTTSDDTVRNGPDDYDLTIYSARKFAKLVIEGNPSLVNLLWAPENMKILTTPQAERLLAVLRANVWSKTAISKFLGYMNAQIKRMNGESKKHTPNRPELVEKYGYDTKFAGHAIRLGFQGLEFARSGKITLPMPGSERSFVLDIREGKYELGHVVYVAESFVKQLEEQLDRTDIPRRPNTERVEEVVIDLHTRYWYSKNLLNIPR